MATDDELLQAARRAFEKYGYAGATLQRIADEAGLSRVTLHRRGILKDGLLAELVVRATDDYRRALWPALTAEGPAGERLEQALTALCGVVEANLGLLLALRAQSDSVFHEAAGEKEETMTRSVFTEPLEKLLRDGVADGSINCADPVEGSTTIFNMVGWTYLHLRSDHRWSPAQTLDAVAGIVLHGLLRGEELGAARAL